MQAFLNDPAVQKTYIGRVKAHALADEIVQGTYWENGHGCAVGCTIHSGQHADYEKLLGIPRELAYLQDAIFEALLPAEAKKFPLQFLKAIPLGADLSRVWDKFHLWLLIDEKEGLIAIPRDAYHALILRRAALFYAALLLVALSGCATYVNQHAKVPDWPELRMIVHEVSNAEMRDACESSAPWWGSPMACANFDFDKRECHVWLSKDFPLKGEREHEALHCQGYDHYNGGSMAAELADWKGRAK